MTIRAAFVGAGRMGQTLVARFGAADGAGRVFDRDFARAELAATDRIVPVETLEDLRSGCPVVVLCLPTSAVCREVVSTLARDPGDIRSIVECSTVGPEAVETEEDLLSQTGIGLLDAPVSGGAKGPSLTAIVSGSEAAKADALPVVAAFTDRMIDCGSRPGNAQIAKLANNALSLGTLALASEILSAAARKGVALEQLIEVVNGCSGRCAATEQKFPKAVVPRTFDYGASLAIALKDITLACDMLDIDTPDSALAMIARDWKSAAKAFPADDDFTKIYRFFEERITDPAPRPAANHAASTRK